MVTRLDNRLWSLLYLTKDLIISTRGYDDPYGVSVNLRWICCFITLFGDALYQCHCRSQVRVATLGTKKCRGYWSLTMTNEAMLKDFNDSFLHGLVSSFGLVSELAHSHMVAVYRLELL